MIYLVKYVGDPEETIEGYVESREDFEQWLKKHNKQRKSEGNIIENNDEFELIELMRLR